MVPAVALHEEVGAWPAVPLVARDEVIARYRQLRAISKQHHNKVFDFLSRSTIMQQARRLGIADGKTLILDNMSELDLVRDLVVYTAAAGRSRAVDRYARSMPPLAGSDEALTLNAMRKARFAVLIMQRRHPVAGVILLDLFRDEEIWLVDEGLETWMEKGTSYATRYYTPEQFAMTAGVGIPIGRQFLIDAIETFAPHLERKTKDQAIDDPRFAEAIYRAALYVFASEGVVPAPFGGPELDAIWRVKPPGESTEPQPSPPEPTGDVPT